jgi:hypothetical protein
MFFSNKSPSTHNLLQNRARGGLEEGRQEEGGGREGAGGGGWMIGWRKGGLMEGRNRGWIEGEGGMEGCIEREGDALKDGGREVFATTLAGLRN